MIDHSKKDIQLFPLTILLVFLQNPVCISFIGRTKLLH